MKKIFPISSGRLEVYEYKHDCYRDYYGHLGLYGKEQFKMYGSKKTISALIEHRYGITPGKYIRQLDDIILFFPTKIGLSGCIAKSKWKIEQCYIGPKDGLVAFSICDKSITATTMHIFRKSLEIGGLTSGGLLLYQYGRLYCVRDDSPDDRFWIQEVTDYDLLKWQQSLP